MIFASVIKIVLYVIFWSSLRSGDLKTRWFLTFITVSYFFDAAYYIENYLLPFIQEHWDMLGLELGLIQLTVILNYLLQIVLPYSLIMFASAYSDIFRALVLKRLAFLYLLPVMLMFIISGFHHAFFIQYSLLFAWTALYSLASCVYLTLSYLKESHPRKRKNKRNSAILFIPGILMYLFSNYFTRAFFPGFDGKPFIPYIVGFMFIVFVITLIGYGTLGIRFRLERQRLDQSLLSITNGTDMYNHALKNRINNINLQAALIKQHVEPDSYIANKMNLVLSESSNMMEMVQRTQHQISEIELNESENPIGPLIYEAIEMCRKSIDDYQITVSVLLMSDIRVLGDRFHLQEMLLNLFRNAVEAMKSSGGKLEIQMEQRQKFIEIEIRDTGPGISKTDLTRIFNPFYSTKRNDQNFGLGLTYSYQVANKHGGSIEVQSELGLGATFLVRLPLKRIVEARQPQRNAFSLEVNEKQ
jgi:signal transduction histidine kinase